jgi:GR25 family glycosyltransferase involved in LPS biosynthesis
MLEHTGLNKLKGFSPIYVINLESKADRLDYIKNHFEKYEIKDYKIIPAYDGDTFDFDKIVFEKDKLQLAKNELGATVSHLEAIKLWLETSDSEYAIIAEDDLSLETVDFWNFEFSSFVESIKKPYDMLQLCIIHNYRVNPSLHMKEKRDWSAACYLIKRNRAEALLKKYFIDGKYVLPSSRVALADILIYEGCKTLSIPLFTYTMDYGSSINLEFDKTAEETGKFSIHTTSKEQTLEYWRNHEVPKLVF